MEAETSHLPLTRLAHYFRSYLGLSIKARKLTQKRIII